ncbi:phosphosulfolactate synthase [Paenibacillus sp. CC-CFT747]|nr:phosphosulfolactate synthase [Paenibacillus sp. CC-CFT747]
MSECPAPCWPPILLDPTESREEKPRASGKTMVIDKGLGRHAFEDLLETAAAHIDMIKIGFGTAPLYPTGLLIHKIRSARQKGLVIYPGGTFLEAAVARGVADSYLDSVVEFGFNAVEISDGTIEMDRRTRDELIAKGLERGLTVYTEYGKKCWGSMLEVEELVETVNGDIRAGAELVTIEARESGTGVGIFDENGKCRDHEVLHVMERIPAPTLLLWEAPQKEQQVHLLKMLGHDLNLGNIAAPDVLSLEALRRGLRSDTFVY